MLHLTPVHVKRHGHCMVVISSVMATLFGRTAIAAELVHRKTHVNINYEQAGTVCLEGIATDYLLYKLVGIPHGANACFKHSILA